MPVLCKRNCCSGWRERTTSAQRLVKRAQIILQGLKGTGNSRIAQHLQIDDETVRGWRDRWHAAESRLQAIEATGKRNLLSQAIEVLLTDEQRPGAPATFTFEQFMQIMALACETPASADRPVSSWTPHELADEVVRRGIVERISPRTVERFLKGERVATASQALLAHPPPDNPTELAEQICTVCEVYEATPTPGSRRARM